MIGTFVDPNKDKVRLRTKLARFITCPQDEYADSKVLPSGLVFILVSAVNALAIIALMQSNTLGLALYDAASALPVKMNDTVWDVLAQYNAAEATLSILSIAAAGLLVQRAITASSSRSIGWFQRNTKSMLLNDALGISYLLHGALLLCGILGAMFLVPSAKEQPERQTSCEFILQPTKEYNLEKSKYFSIDPAKEHGRFNPALAENNSHSSAMAKPKLKYSRSVKSRSALGSHRQEQSVRQANSSSQSFLIAGKAAKAKTENENQSKPVESVKVRSALNRTPGMVPVESKPVAITAVAPQTSRRTRRELQRQSSASIASRRRLSHRQTRVAGSHVRPDRPRHKTASSSISGSHAAGQGLGARTPFNAKHNVDDMPASHRARADMNFGPYMLQVQRRIKRSWSPPGGQTAVVKVHFKIHTGGRLSSLRLVRSSGNGSYDEAALQAVRMASPFMPLPEGRTAPLDIEFDFSY